MSRLGELDPNSSEKKIKVNSYYLIYLNMPGAYSSEYFPLLIFQKNVMSEASISKLSEHHLVGLNFQFLRKLTYFMNCQGGS